MNHPRIFTLAVAVFLAGSVLTGCTPPQPRGSAKESALKSAPKEVVRSVLTPSVVQPNYQKWQLIKPDMEEAEVDRLVGPPLERGSEDPNSGTVYISVYGRMDFDRRIFPEPYEFYVIFHNGTHRAFQIADPFGGQFAGPEGWPTVPRLIYPADGAQFDHYPRYVDLRWWPSSGTYPMQYEVQTNTHPEQGWSSGNVRTYGTDVPYLAITWGGQNAGVWRVRAVNAVGASQWSEQRTLGFDR